MLTMTRRNVIAAAATLLAGRPILAQTEPTPMRVRCTFANQEFTVALQDSATTRDFVSMLPLDLTISDFSTNEKIAHLPRRLDEGGLVDYTDEAPGDLCYFRGWGNLAFFHDSYSYRGDLIRLGRIEGRIDPLLVNGEFPLRIELIS
ncbi:cyclophilin-like fold protein [Paracoccus sp. S1E-3]|uniref:cyclophilin-like fold protein n=1 Tax=Paracoccus sp. S1E-3 TaxID=2756130 RepID=UPI002102A8E5|nr:cyclophilin-like fold protein [Paracoccus sp. S1E-3]